MTDSIPRLAPRAADAHKGDFGRVLCIGGSPGMCGAIALAGLACLRSGAGLVRIATPEACEAIVAAHEPSFMTMGIATDDRGLLGERSFPQLMQQAEWATCVALGPGLGRSPSTVRLVKLLYGAMPLPMVIDADALFELELGDGLDSQAAPAPRILTPHPGEFQRLTGVPAHARQAQIEAARELARRHQILFVLKGSRTFVTDGRTEAFNETGNPGLATGGSGDVLTGIIAALIGQTESPFAAARLGVHVHGLAGDLAAAELGEVSLIASDLPKFLPSAFRQLAQA